ncbi:hypothetical protein [uncultured Clostridium sp.]|uniref:hypothetical protein n=1 Tax=uncultured Clostridium sp. TaxID=59620 RepID=UPI0025F20F2D|nr:hypothetical protein [uncultured Clostridium sp.]
MKKISKKLSLILTLSILITTALLFNTNSIQASASTNGLTITQVGDTRDYGYNTYKAINPQQVKGIGKTYTVNSKVAHLQYKIPSNYHTGAKLWVNGSCVSTNPRCIGFKNLGDYCYVTLLVTNLYPNMINTVEVKDGGVGCPIASDSINIRIAN